MDLLKETLKNIRKINGEDIDLTIYENYWEIKRTSTIDKELSSFIT